MFLFIQGRLNNLSYCLDRGLEFTAPSRFSVGLASARFPLVVPVYSSLRSAPHTRGVTRPLRINGPPRLATWCLRMIYLFLSGFLPLFAGPIHGMTFLICVYLCALASGLLLRFFGNNFSPSFSLPLFFVNRIVTTSFWSPSFSARRVPPSSLLSSLFSATVIVVSLVGVSTIPTARCDLFLCPPILLTYLFFFVSYFSLFKVLYANPYYASYSSSRRLIRNKLIYFVQNIVAIYIILKFACEHANMRTCELTRLNEWMTDENDERRLRRVILHTSYMYLSKLEASFRLWNSGIWNHVLYRTVPTRSCTYLGHDLYLLVTMNLSSTVFCSLIWTWK